MLKKWDMLPDNMRNEDVRYYYDILNKNKGQLWLKRIFDCTLAIFSSIIFAPIMIIIALLIKIKSPGKVFYRQERVTSYGKKFKVFKFRTMVEDADKIGSHVTGDNDSRITSIGKILRKYRLDEIPQIFNVLLGDMTFVGTRPEAVRYVENYSDKMWATLLLPAGITSETSLIFKDEAELLKDKIDIDKTYIEEILPIKMKYNLHSVENFSIVNDIKTMLKTVIEVFK